LTIMKNGVATTLQVIISDTNTFATDTTNSVSYVAGDTLSIQCVPSTTIAPAASSAQSWNVAVTTANLTAPILSALAGASTTVTQYASLTAGHVSALGWSATETDSEIIIPTGGTISDFYVKLSSTPGTSKSYQFTIMQNGSASAIDLTLSGAVGSGSDTTNSISVSAGDVITIRCIPTNTPISQTSMAFGLVFTPTTPGESFFGFGSTNAPSASATNYEQVLGVGNNAWTASESARTMVLGPYTLKKIYVKLGTAPGVGASRTIALRKAGATTALSVTIADANTTGNAAADITYAQGDTITYISSVSGTPVADTGGVHTGVLIYAAPTGNFVPIIMLY
jgi:hypothetical protein